MEMIEVTNLSKSYGIVTALKGVSFSVSEGDIVGYVGPNGSGKTTTIKVITGLCKPDAGSVTILNIRVAKDYAKLRNKIAVIFEEPSDYDYLTAWENLEFYARLVNMPGPARSRRIQKSLEYMGMADRKGTLVKTFSKGMKRKLAVARALLAEPQILILDEPFDGIDVSSRMRIVDYLKEWVQQGGHSILLASHNMYEVEELCNNIIILKGGEILASGSLAELQCGCDEYNVEVALHEHAGQARIREVLENYERKLSYRLDERTLALTMDSREIPCLSSFLYQHGIGFDEIRKRHENLNEIYLRVVGHHD